MRGPWTVTRRRVFVCSCSLLSFIVVQVPRCVPGYSCASGRRGPPSRVRARVSRPAQIPKFPINCSRSRAQAVARREEKGFIRRTAETPTEPARAPVGCMPRPDPRRLRTNANQSPMTRTAAASPGGSPGQHAPHPIGALRPDTCDASRKPLRVESTLRRSHSISRSTCRADSQRLSSCPLSLSLELDLSLELELVVILSEAAVGACPADKRHLRYT
jgi:hypothetical protein